MSEVVGSLGCGMLREGSRISRREGFSRTLKEGYRAGNRVMVVSVRRNLAKDKCNGHCGARGGIIVGKRQVPLATQRNQVKRRLRHLLQARLSSMQGDTTVVVRALEGAVGMSSEELGRNLDRLLALAFKKMTANSGKRVGSSGIVPTPSLMPCPDGQL